jgi:Flp pilus assembly pilin Flp
VTKAVRPLSWYGLIAAGMSIAIITVVSGLGSKLNATFTWVQAVLE